ncbi:FHA domain-containing protein [bacterium]|nr:FHA domain-containing protein [bacterium]
MARLTVEHGQGKGRVFDLLSSNTTIGRESYNTMQIEDKNISESHCLIERRLHSYYLEDLDSTNGTFLNQKRISRVKLASSDKIGIGETILVFQKDKREEAKGMSTIVEETSKEIKQGIGYATLLSETVKEVKNQDLKKAAKSGGVIKQILHSFGWSKTDADKLTKECAGKKKEDFPISLILKVDSPKTNERIIRLREKLKGIDGGNIVNYDGKDYLVLNIKEDSAGTTYRLKEC